MTQQPKAWYQSHEVGDLTLNLTSYGSPAGPIWEVTDEQGDTSILLTLSEMEDLAKLLPQILEGYRAAQQ